MISVVGRSTPTADGHDMYPLMADDLGGALTAHLEMKKMPSTWPFTRRRGNALSATAWREPGKQGALTAVAPSHGEDGANPLRVQPGQPATSSRRSRTASPPPMVDTAPVRRLHFYVPPRWRTRALTFGSGLCH